MLSLLRNLIVAVTILTASATGDTTLANSSYTQLNGMVHTAPGAGEYIAIFSFFLEVGAGAADDLNIALFNGGTIVTGTEMLWEGDTSVDNNFIPMSVAAHVTVTGSNDVEIRYKETGSSTRTGKNRTLLLYPVSDASVISQSAATGTTTRSSSSFATLDQMTSSLAANDYVAILSTSNKNPSNQESEFSVHVDGAEIVKSRRNNESESSAADTMWVVNSVCEINPDATETCDVKWRKSIGSGTSTTNDRILLFFEIDTAQIQEASSTSDSSITNTTYAIMNSLSLTPGADNYVFISNTTQYFANVASNTGIVDYTPYVNGASVSAHMEKTTEHESSIDAANLLTALCIGEVIPTAGQDVDAMHKCSDSNTRIIRERVMLLFTEEVAGTSPITGISALVFVNPGTLLGSGILAGPSAMVFANAGALLGAGALAGSSLPTFANTGVLGGAGPLAGVSLPVFANSGTLVGTGVLTGQSFPVFSNIGTMVGAGALAGVSLPTFTNNGVMTGAAPIDGAIALIFANTGTVVGSGALVGVSNPIFSNTGVLAGAGALLGSSDLVFIDTATLLGAGALAGSTLPVFTLDGILEALGGSIDGVVNVVFVNTGILTGSGALDGVSPLVFANPGTLIGEALVSGVAPLVFTDVGVLIGEASITGAIPFTFVNAGVLAGVGDLIGSSDLAFLNDGTLVGAGELAGISPLVFLNTGTLAGAAVAGLPGWNRPTLGMHLGGGGGPG